MLTNIKIMPLTIPSGRLRANLKACLFHPSY